MLREVKISSLCPKERNYLRDLGDRMDVKRRDFLSEVAEAAEKRADTMKRITERGGEPTYRNTILPAERAEEEYQGLFGEYRGLMDLAPSTEMREQEEAITKIDTDENERELFDSGFARRIRQLWKNSGRKGAGIGGKLIRDYYRGFLLGGAYLPGEKKKKLAKLERKLSEAELAYGKKIDRLPKYAFLSRKRELAGLGKRELAEARRMAKRLGRSGWALRLEPTLAQPAAAKLSDSGALRSVMRAAVSRGIRMERCALEIARLRKEIAGVLGFRSWSHLKFFENESGSPAKVWNIFRKSLPSVRLLFERDERTAKNAGWKPGKGSRPLWSFFPENEQRGGFDPVRVLERGCFWVAGKLFNLEFLRVRGAKTYHSDVRVYLVKRRGKTQGFMMTDFWQRSGKGDGAWAISWDGRRTADKYPSVSMCFNFNRKMGCSMEGVVTVFHEFGHAIHALFTSHLQPSHAGLECSNDFVEIPSQVAEHWAYDREVYQRYAGRRAPSYEEVAGSVEDGAGAAYLASIISAGSDLVWHGEGAARLSSANQADSEAAGIVAAGLSSAEPRYKSSHFEHIFNSGYDASYYSYLWCELKAGQIHGWMTDNGGVCEKNGRILLRHIYGVGGDRVDNPGGPWEGRPGKLSFEFRGGWDVKRRDPNVTKPRLLS